MEEEGVFVEVFPEKAVFIVHREVEIIIKPDGIDGIKTRYIFNDNGELKKKLIERFDEFNIPYKSINENEIEVCYDTMYYLDCFDHIYEKLTMGGDTEYIRSLLDRLFP